MRLVRIVLSILISLSLSSCLDEIYIATPNTPTTNPLFKGQVEVSYYSPTSVRMKVTPATSADGGTSLAISLAGISGTIKTSVIQDGNWHKISNLTPGSLYALSLVNSVPEFSSNISQPTFRTLGSPETYNYDATLGSNNYGHARL